jgi:hypothetical protein
MKKRDTVDALRQEEALILAWIGEITGEKQARLHEIRRRLKRIARVNRQKQSNAIPVQTSVENGVRAERGE